MNFLSCAFLLCGILFCVQINAEESDQLKKDLQEFKALLPKTKITYIAGKHLFFDKQLKDAKKYLKSNEFSSSWKKLITTKEFQNLVTYLDKSGINIVKEINHLTKYLNLEPLPEITKEQVPTARSVDSFLEEVIKALPKDKIHDLYVKKLQTSSEFKHLIDRLTSQEFSGILNSMKKTSEYSDIDKQLQAHHVNIEMIGNVAKTVIGMN